MSFAFVNIILNHHNAGLGTEAPVMTWIMPGLDRLRLDFVEAGEKVSAEELEQLSSDLRQRLASQPNAM